MATADAKKSTRSLPASLLLLATIAVYGAVAGKVLLHGQTFTEEVTALIKSWWYVSGVVRPYTATDATWTMPGYFYVLGAWQELAGIGPLGARALSIGLGVVNGVLLFLICRRLTANTVAAAAGVFIFLATPATVFYFASATPAALASVLHLAAIWLIVAHLGRPRLWATVAMALLCVAMVLVRQNMLL